MFRLDCDFSLSRISMLDSKFPNFTCHVKSVILLEGCSWCRVFNFGWLGAWFWVHRLIVLLLMRVLGGVGSLQVEVFLRSESGPCFIVLGKSFPKQFTLGVYVCETLFLLK